MIKKVLPDILTNDKQGCILKIRKPFHQIKNIITGDANYEKSLWNFPTNVYSLE